MFGFGYNAPETIRERVLDLGERLEEVLATECPSKIGGSCNESLISHWTYQLTHEEWEELCLKAEDKDYVTKEQSINRILERLRKTNARDKFEEEVEDLYSSQKS
jgi:hypothetical protein